MFLFKSRCSPATVHDLGCLLIWKLTCGTGGMEDPAVDAADAPLLFAVRYLIREYRNCIGSLQFMLDENRDLFVPLPNDHPVALGIPLPHSLLAPHRQFCDAVRAAIATIESLVEYGSVG